MLPESHGRRGRRLGRAGDRLWHHQSGTRRISSRSHRAHVVSRSYPKMAEKGFAYLLRHFWRGLPRWKEVVREIGDEPKANSYKKREEFEKAEADFMKRFMETHLFQTDYLDKVADGLVHAKESGNSYSASEKSCLSMLLETKAMRGVDLAGKRGGSGNYGSGCKAKASSWTVE